LIIYFSDQNVVRLTQFPNRYTKVLAMKQPRSRDILFFKWAMPLVMVDKSIDLLRTNMTAVNIGKWVPFIL